MEELTTENWKAIDELIVADRIIHAIKVYRERSGSGMNEAIEIISRRKHALMENEPERFKTDAEYRAEAFSRLRNIVSRIVVIEGSWDGDSEGWFIRLSAITEQPSQQHPKYSEYGLSIVRGLEQQVERAKTLGTELANAVGVDFDLTATNTDVINYEKRWWDDQEGHECL